MSKPYKHKKRKRKTGYINLVKPSPFQNTFYSFVDFNNWLNSPASTEW